MGSGESRVDGLLLSSAHVTGGTTHPADSGGPAPDILASQETFGLISADLTDVVEKGMPEVATIGLDRVWSFDMETEEWSVIDIADVVRQALKKCTELLIDFSFYGSPALNLIVLV